MSRWVKINVILFITIVLLALFTRFMSSKNSTSSNATTTLAPTAAPVVLPSQTPATTSAVTDPAVLGAAIVTDEQPNTGELTRYESSRLGFMTMLPAQYVIKNDILRFIPKDSEPTTSAAQADRSGASCSFMRLSTSMQTDSGANLESIDLPLVSVQTASEGEKVYLIRNEENLPRLEVHCSSDWNVTEAFYTILRSIRFV